MHMSLRAPAILAAVTAAVMAATAACAPAVAPATAAPREPAAAPAGASGPIAAERIAADPDQPRIEWGLVMHGGAGTISRESLTPELESAYRQSIAASLQAGHRILSEGGSSVDAVVAAIVILEDSPLFNAGKGAVFAADGTNYLDASIMDGATGQAGAVAGVRRIRNPIRLARAVMDHSPHVMLAGSGAEEFAAEQGLERVDPSYFHTDRRWEALQRARELADRRSELLPEGGPKPAGAEVADQVSPYGTVGVIALDRNGTIAAGTSTGGTTNKKWDRIGDSPIIGAGTFASASCGISSTGKGEFFIRNVVAYDICARAKYQGISLHEAAHAMIMEQLEAQEPETGGIVGLDGRGRIVMVFNTPGMYRGYIDADGLPQTEIYR
jgi:L-asparaginase / beta-aspartyl-peptidase